jgi:predicted transposase YbfD/YdcC
VVEVRKLWCDIDNAEYICKRLGIPGCQIILRVDREVYDKDSVLKSHDVRYFLTSLDPGKVTPDDLQKLVRDHWQVETSLHFVKDRWWDEDRHYFARDGLGAAFLALTNAALSVLRLVQQPGEPLTETAENFHYSPRKALQMLGFNKL